MIIGFAMSPNILVVDRLVRQRMELQSRFLRSARRP